VSELWVCQLGLVPYREALALQERVRDAREAGRVPDVLLLLEHPLVATRGRRSDPSELPLGEAWYAARGMEIVDVDRGGKVTLHAPGQLVGYPITQVADVVAHVRAMERALIAALAPEGVAARSRSVEGPDYTGVWTQDRKIASIGVHVRKGITTHGFALNVDNDLEPFSWIVPCGLTLPMTSLAAETGRSGLLRCARRRVAHAWATELGARQRLVTPTRLERALSADVALA
jgi:lipoyl(octanoyl) transferase